MIGEQYALEALMKESSSSRGLLAQELTAIARQQGVRIGDAVDWHPLPIFLQAGQTDRLNALVQGLVELEYCALRDETLARRLLHSLSPGGRWLVEQGWETPEDPLDRFRRVDGFWVKDQIMPIEINQIAPLGHYTYDCSLARAQHLVTRLGGTWTPPFVYEQLYAWMMRVFRQRHADLPKRIAVVTESGYRAKAQELPGTIGNLNRYAVDCGVATRWVLVEPPDVQVRNGEIYCQEQKADMLWRNSVYLTPYREHSDRLRDYEYICSHPEDFTILNDTRSWLSATKEALAVLWETGDFADVLPATHALGYASKELLDHVINTKDCWVSKPTDASSGTAVVFGSECSPFEWERLCYARSAPGFIVQQLLEPEPQPLVAINKDGELMRENFTMDVCPYFINRGVSRSVLCRARPFGRVGVMNLTEGSFPLPCCFEEGTP